MLAILEEGANIHIEKQSSPKMDPVIMANYMEVRLPDGSTIESPK